MPATSDEELRAVFDCETIAVVGCSTTSGKAAHDIPKYLREQGYEILPVNPYADEIFGVEAADSVADVEADIDIVDIFRPSEEVAGIVDAVLERDDVDAVWTQLGISDDEAAERVEASGRTMVQDKCMKVEHQRLF